MHAPDGAEHPGRQGGVPALLDVAHAECDAVGGDAEAGATQILFEAVHDEAALDFLAHAAGDHDDHREDDRVTPRLNHRLERVERHVVEARREGQHQTNHHDHRQEHDRHQRDADQALAQHAALAEQDVVDRLAPRLDEEQHQGDHQDSVDQRQHEDEGGGQPASRGPHAHAEAGHDQHERQLGRIAGAQHDLEQSHHPQPGRRRTAQGDGRLAHRRGERRRGLLGGLFVHSQIVQASARTLTVCSGTSGARPRRRASARHRLGKNRLRRGGVAIGRYGSPPGRATHELNDMPRPGPGIARSRPFRTKNVAWCQSYAFALCNYYRAVVHFARFYTWMK